MVGQNLAKRSRFNCEWECFTKIMLFSVVLWEVLIHYCLTDKDFDSHLIADPPQQWFSGVPQNGVHAPFNS